jgi:hypothetical protein
MGLRRCAANRIESLEVKLNAQALVHICLYLAVRRETTYGSLI